MPFNCRVQIFLWAPFLSVFLSAGIIAQTSPDYRVTRDEVIVDVVAVDEAGDFVSDLRLDELTVSQNGRRQELNFFEYHQPSRIWQESGVRSSQSPSDTGFNSRGRFARPTRQVSLIFLIDLTSISQRHLVKVQEAVRNFLQEQAVPGDRFMLATLEGSLKVLQPFTRDLSALLRGLDGLRSTVFEEEMSVAEFMEREVTPLLEDLPAPSRIFRERSLILSIQHAAEEFLARWERRVATRTQVLSAFSTYLRSLPGRKHIVFCSAGAPVTPGWSIAEALEPRLGTQLLSIRRHSSAPYVQKLIDAANRAQVSFYSIDGRGLVASAAGGQAPVSRREMYLLRSGAYTRMVNEDINSPQELLRSLASATGGRVYLNSNDLGRGIRGAYAESKNYYLLGYSPDVKLVEGRLQRIEIQVSRPGVKLRYRKGYIETAEQEVADRDLVNALKFPEVFRDFPLHVQSSRQAKRLKVRAGIETEMLQFGVSGGQYRCPIELFVGLRDLNGELVGGGQALKGVRLDLDLNQEELDTLRKNPGVSLSTEKEVEPGSYKMILVARQGIPSRIATWVGRIEITQ